MPDIGDLLGTDQLTRLRASYNSKRGEKEIDGILRGVLPDLYSESSQFIGAIIATYFDGDSAAPPKWELNKSDRERCIIALLAGQGAQFPLSLHIYLALMLGVTPQEVAHIILLSGVYTGVNRFAEGMFVHVKTLRALNGLQGDIGPNAVNAALRVVFGVDPPKPAPAPATQPA
jgi:alkylhydroperoxidase/carboxymuconolactone decarboxylase family protein YurZ